MIKLFISDIDGCLSEPFRPYELGHFQTLAAYARRAAAEPGLPALSLCSGRAYPYVEAMSQVLGLHTPVLFESGGGLFDPVSARLVWNPAFTEAVAERMEAVRHWLVQDVLPGTSMMYDYGKRTHGGVIGPDVDEVARFVPIVARHVAAHFPGLVVFHTPVSIDVVYPGITKKQAMHWLAQETGISVAEMAYIGDSNGDIEALREVGYGFAPANATPDVQAAADVVTRGAVIDGVLEAYRWCLARNQAPAAAGA